jgi:hypothetical protein
VDETKANMTDRSVTKQVAQLPRISPMLISGR